MRWFEPGALDVEGNRDSESPDARGVFWESED